MPLRSFMVGLGLLLTAAVAHATVMVEVSLEDMTADADAIVRGTVVSSAVQMVFRRGSMDPHTVTGLRVQEWIHGSGEETIRIREIGGDAGQYGGMWISGTPRYEVGEEVIVFLRRDPLDATVYRTYGMAQGKFRVLHGTPGVPSIVTRDLETISFVSWLDGRSRVQHAGRAPTMALAGFEAHIRQTLRQLDGGAP